MSKKIILNNEQYEFLTSYMLVENISIDNLNEGAWENIKYFLSKLGRYKAGGSTFNKNAVDTATSSKIQDIISKKGNEIISNLDNKIKSSNPEFPNNAKSTEFLNTVLVISAVYDSIVHSTQLQPTDKSYLPPDIANGIINDLREYVKKFLDVDLKAAYSVVDEDASSDVRQHLQAKRGSGNDFQSDRMKTLGSNKLPITLSSIGGSLGAFKWLVHTEWFQNLFKTIEYKTDVGEITKTITEKSNDFANIQPNQGLTQIMNQLRGFKLTPASSPDDFVNAVKAMGGGNLTDGINSLSAQGGIFANPSDAHDALMEIAKNPHAHGNNLGELFRNKWAGTGKSFGDVFTTQTGGNLKGLITNTLTKSIPSIITKASVKVGAGYAMAKGLGSLLGPIGVGLLTGGALVKLMRLKGQKQSRAKTLNDLYQSIRDVQGGVMPNVARGTSPAASTDDVYNSIKNIFKFLVSNRKSLGVRSSDNVGTGLADELRGLKAGDRRLYNGKKVIVLKPNLSVPNKTLVQFGNGNKIAVDTSKLQNMNESINEGRYIKDKRLIHFLSRSLSFDKLKLFEDFIGMVEQVRNKIRNLKTDDKVLADLKAKFNNNPIMATNFSELFNISPDDPAAVNSLKAFIDDLFITIYSSEFKYINMIDKLSDISEESGYNATEPNKAFLKDAQDRGRFKANLTSFLRELISIFQYLNKIRSKNK